MGALNIFKDFRHHQKEKRNKGKTVIFALLMDVFCLDIWSNEVQDSEKEEEQPQQVSDWSKEIENTHDYRARVSTLRRRPGQPPRAILFHPSRRRPAG